MRWTMDRRNPGRERRSIATISLFSTRAILDQRITSGQAHRTPLLPEPHEPSACQKRRTAPGVTARAGSTETGLRSRRSEEHTSELQSQSNLVCRLLLEKKK